MIDLPVYSESSWIIVAARDEDGFDFKERFGECIAENAAFLLEKL